MQVCLRRDSPSRCPKGRNNRAGLTNMRIRVRSWRNGFLREGADLWRWLRRLDPTLAFLSAPELHLLAIPKGNADPAAAELLPTGLANRLVRSPLRPLQASPRAILAARRVSSVPIGPVCTLIGAGKQVCRRTLIYAMNS